MRDRILVTLDTVLMLVRVVPCSWPIFTGWAAMTLGPIVLVVMVGFNQGFNAELIGMLILAPGFVLFGWAALKSVVLVGAGWARPGAWWEAKPVRSNEIREVRSEGFDLILWMLDGRQVTVASSPQFFDPGNERAIRRIARAIEQKSKGLAAD